METTEALGRVIWWLMLGLGAAALTYIMAAIISRGNLRATICVWRGEHRWRWTHNEQVPIESAYTIARLTSAMRWVGRYTCTTCGELADGQARWEESHRKLRGEPTELEVMSGQGCAMIRPRWGEHEFDLNRRCRMCALSEAEIIQNNLVDRCAGIPV